MALTRATRERWRKDAVRLAPHLVSIGQVAQRLGVPQNTASTWAAGLRGTSHPFPEPVMIVGSPTGRTRSRGMALYMWQEVEEWARQTGKLPVRP